MTINQYCTVNYDDDHCTVSTFYARHNDSAAEI